MTMVATTELKQSLQKLAETIGGMVTNAKAQGTIQPEQEALWKWKVKEFEYGEQGITKSQAEGQYITNRMWLKASITLGKLVAETAEFTSVLSELKEVYPAAAKQDLERFAGSILHICLSRDTADEVQRENEDTIRKFLNDLSGGLVVYKAKVELQGVTLEPMNIALDAGVSIRQPIREDLEKTLRPIGPLGHTLTHPSAILEVELRSTRGRNALLQAKIEQCVALLRLFNVGSVSWISYDMSSDSLLDILGGGTMGSGVRLAALDTYVIKTEEEASLKRFWETLTVLLPKDIYDFHKQISHITLAFDRYSDAVLHNGIVERRIANAVMGLEALFLEETQELSYRLGLRISKILSIVGRNPLKVREFVKEAYAIRSAFAHGGHLDYKAKKRLERKYGDVKTLLRSILDYLRASIIIMILSRVPKDELVDLIDDALLDADRNQELQSRLSDARAIIGA